MLGIVGLFLLAGFLLARFAPAKPGSEPSPAAIAVAAVARAVVPEPVAEAAQSGAATPYFATLRGVKLRLPIDPASVTVVAFHQASYSDALAMDSLVGKASLVRLSRSAPKGAAKPATLAAPAAAATQVPLVSPLGIWTGKALGLWRSGRAGAMNSAFDCGARPGTPVFSPVDGTVMEIRSYRLYGKYPDFEIHIKPDAWSDVDLVILHTTDPLVSTGQHVVAGETQVSSVRRLAGVVSGIQLAEYTREGGNHCHVQFNRISRPDLPWAVGSDPPGLVRKSP